MTGTVKPTQADNECVAEMLRAGEFWPGHEVVTAMREIAARHRIASQADLLSAVREARQRLATDYETARTAPAGWRIKLLGEAVLATLARLDTLLSEETPS